MIEYVEANVWGGLNADVSASIYREPSSGRVTCWLAGLLTQD